MDPAESTTVAPGGAAPATHRPTNHRTLAVAAVGVCLLVLVAVVVLFVTLIIPARESEDDRFVDGVRQHAPAWSASKSRSELLAAGHQACSLLINNDGNLKTVGGLITIGTGAQLGSVPTSEQRGLVVVLQQAGHHLCKQFSGELGNDLDQ